MASGGFLGGVSIETSCFTLPSLLNSTGLFFRGGFNTGRKEVGEWEGQVSSAIL